MLKYLRLKLTIKPTFQAQDWYTNPQEWFKWRDKIYNQLSFESKGIIDVESISNLQPTIAHGFTYTKEDGEAYAKWRLPFRRYNVTCSAGINSYTIDYLGNLYDCPLLKNRLDIDDQKFNLIFENKVSELLAKQDISELNDMNLLKHLVWSNYCSAIDTEKDIENYLRLFGNGALYYHLEE